MTLQKRRSNSTDVLNSIPENLQEKAYHHLHITSAIYQKAVGIDWDASTDYLHVATPFLSQDDNQPKDKLLQT